MTIIIVKNIIEMRISCYIILQLALISGLYSCKTSKQLTSVSGPSATEVAYIDSYKDIAVSEMKRTGIPASITLAQGMIESDYGRSHLAREANNHFGIKCHNDWSGPKIYHNDDRRNECFRKYGKPEESFYDHSEFLRSGSRYDFLFKLDATDYISWARGLKKAGYATNPDYANMLIRKIEEENLSYYDRGYNPASLAQVNQVAVQGSPVVRDTDKTVISADQEKTINPVGETTFVVARVPRVMENNRIQYIVAKDGDTREKIENEFSLLRWELPKYNELSDDFSVVPGQVLYIQPKREKAEPGKEYHYTVDGDTMYLISQRYGVKLKSLYKMNRMEDDTEPGPGKKIWLSSSKPVN